MFFKNNILNVFFLKITGDYLLCGLLVMIGRWGSYDLILFGLQSAVNSSLMKM